MVSKKALRSKKNWWEQRLPVKLFWPLFAVMALVFAISIFNIFSLFVVRRELMNNLDSIREEIGIETTENNEAAYVNYSDLRHLGLSADEAELATITPETLIPATPADILAAANSYIPAVEEQLLSGRLNSFGDSFSGLAYVNQSQTDMYWDENVTAFTLPPVYAVQKQSDCSQPDCGLSRADIDPRSICLSAGCLRKTNDLRIFFNNRLLILPPALSGETLSSITLFSIDDYWLIGLVSGPASDERGWVYRFDGLAFSPLITNETAVQIKPRFQKGGGKIAFGGSAEDFIALYSGYDGRAFRFRNGSSEDISKFFGLRVTDEGFQAQILKLGSGRDSTFYICSVTENKPKIIKIWSKDDMNSGGALDFSPLFFRADWSVDSILCAVSDAAEKKLAVASKRGGAYQLWLAHDQGFDISQSRQITSVNLNRQNQENVKAAVFADMGLETISGCPGAGGEAYLANQNGQFEPVQPYLWHGFNQGGSEVYWRLVVNPESQKYYSPWLDHVNRLDYLFSN